jgi:hypothetical protein
MVRSRLLDYVVWVSVIHVDICITVQNVEGRWLIQSRQKVWVFSKLNWHLHYSKLCRYWQKYVTSPVPIFLDQFAKLQCWFTLMSNIVGIPGLGCSKAYASFTQMLIYFTCTLNWFKANCVHTTVMRNKLMRIKFWIHLMNINQLIAEKTPTIDTRRLGILCPHYKRSKLSYDVYAIRFTLFRS